MRFTLQNAPIGLTGRTPLRIVDGRGTSLQILKGRVWITQEGSLDDVFLDVGQRYRLESAGAALISVEGSNQSVATVRFEGPMTFTSRPSLADWWAQQLAAWHRPRSIA